MRISSSRPGGGSDAGIDFGDEVASPAPEPDIDQAERLYSSTALEIGIEDLQPFLTALGRVAGFTVTVDAHQRAKLVNGVADIDRDDEKDGRPRQSEFAAVLKALVRLIRLRPQDSMRPKTVWHQ